MILRSNNKFLCRCHSRRKLEKLGKGEVLPCYAYNHDCITAGRRFPSNAALKQEEKKCRCKIHKGGCCIIC